MEQVQLRQGQVLETIQKATLLLPLFHPGKPPFLSG